MARDANLTRQQLLQAARRRFAYNGYAATTVRDIATDAGVNVALINRYFGSKEGLFEACITIAGEQLASAEPAGSSIDGLAQKIIGQLEGSTIDEEPARLQMLLLIRSSGDERAETIRRGILLRYAEGMATAAGWTPADGQQLVLNAQIVLATALGMALLRSSTALEPLTSATEQQLTEPVRALLRALLRPEEHGLPGPEGFGG